MRLLALELSGRGLSVANDIAEDDVRVPRRFFRNVLASALLAWCDHNPGAGVLRISGASDASDAELKLQFEVDGTELRADIVSPQRRIGWDDVEALAYASGATLSRGDDWLRLRLRHSSGEPAHNPLGRSC